MKPEAAETLVLYSAACRALAKARTTDEVRKIRSEAAALRAYAKQAKNRQLEVDAAEIRIRAERRVGELIAAQRQSVGLAKGGGTGANKHRRAAGTKQDPAAPTLAAAGIDKHLAERARKLAAVPEQQFETLVADWRDRSQQNGERVTSELLRPKMDLHHSSETPEHYTPASVIELVVACLGEIDLDPCSNPGTPNVPAKVHYTVADDALQQPWGGRIYMNPPYGREIDTWISKLCAEYERRDNGVTAAIALLPARTDTQWFKRLRNYPCCFVEGRLTFIGNEDPAPFPSAVFYLGDNIEQFCHCFHDLGDIWALLVR